jgi:homeobox-leucine zipper protein
VLRLESRDVYSLAERSMEMTVNGRDAEQYHHHLGLGLGLSLGMSGTTSPVEPPAPQRAPARQQQCWNGAGLFFPTSSGEQRTHADDLRLAALACHEMPFLRGIDVNRLDRRASEDEEPGASSPDSTLSSLSGKRGAPSRSGGGIEQERAGAGSDDEDDSGAAGGASRKKLRLSKDQSAVLEEKFKEHSTLNPVSAIRTLTNKAKTSCQKTKQKHAFFFSFLI